MRRLRQAQELEGMLPAGNLRARIGGKKDKTSAKRAK
jgi:hypothetical protein